MQLRLRLRDSRVNYEPKLANRRKLYGHNSVLNQSRTNLLEKTETNFERAWDLQEVRKQGKKIPRGCPDHKLLCYGEIARLGFQVDRLLSLVDSNRVHYTIFDDFRENTKKESRNNKDKKC